MSKRAANSKTTCRQAHSFMRMLGGSRNHNLAYDVRAHIDNCGRCSDEYNAIKWKLSHGSSNLLELREFLDGTFLYGVDASGKLAQEWKSQPRNTTEEVAAFYRETPWYAYNLVLWEASGRRPKYVDKAHPILERIGCKTIADFGAGVGNDSLKLALLGYSVIAIDFDNLSSQFLRYRATRRKLSNLLWLDADSTDLSDLKVDVVWAMDVIEHLPDPVASLAPLLRNARALMFDSEHTETSSGRQDFHIQHQLSTLHEGWKSLGLGISAPLGGKEETLQVLLRGEVTSGSRTKSTLIAYASPTLEKSKNPALTTVVLDLDGVVWRDNHLIANVEKAINAARKRGLQVCFLTNNSSQSRESLCLRLSQLGIETTPSDIFTAAYIAAKYLAGRESADLCITLGGGGVLLSELRAAGLEAESLDDYLRGNKEANHVSLVIGHHPDFGYRDAANLLAISDRIDNVFATERDRWYATSNGHLPSSGWMVAGIEEVLDKQAITLGKPNANALRTVAETLGVAQGTVLMVGDSLRTDIAAARNAGAIACYYDEPHIAPPAEANGDAFIPDFVVRDLLELTYIFEGICDSAKF